MNQVTNKNTSAMVRNPVEQLLSQENFKQELTKLLIDAKAAERMTRMALTELRLQPKLLQCHPASFAAAILKCAEIGLEPSSQSGDVHLIPIENRAKGTIECQVIIGYKGMIKLAYRTGEVKEIYSKTVYANDRFEVLLGTESYLRHVPALKDRGAVIAYYAFCKLINGGELKEILLPEDIEEIRKNSKGMNNPKSPWHSHIHAMSEKSCIRRIFDSLPSKSPQINSALAHDTSIDLGNESPILDLEGGEIIQFDADTGEISPPSKADELSNKLEVK